MVAVTGPSRSLRHGRHGLRREPPTGPVTTNSRYFIVGRCRIVAPRGSGSGPASAALHAQVAGGTVGGASMKIPARGGHRGVPEGLLHEVDGCSAIEAVAGVGVAQPMR